MTLLIPDGLEWNGKEEGSFVERLSYFVLFTHRFSYAITGSYPPPFILSTPKNCKSLHTISFKYLLSLMDWNGMERQRVSLLNGFLTLFYLTIDLALLYRLSPLLYSVDAQILHAQIAKIVTYNVPLNFL